MFCPPLSTSFLITLAKRQPETKEHTSNLCVYKVLGVSFAREKRKANREIFTAWAYSFCQRRGAISLFARIKRQRGSRADFEGLIICRAGEQSERYAIVPTYLTSGFSIFFHFICLYHSRSFPRPTHREESTESGAHSLPKSLRIASVTRGETFSYFCFLASCWLWFERAGLS